MNGRPFREPGAAAEPQPPATARGVLKHMRAASVLMSNPRARAPSWRDRWCPTPHPYTRVRLMIAGAREIGYAEIGRDRQPLGGPHATGLP
jgi:hypothetical protein